MLKLSDKEKRTLSYLITNCEIYQLNEKEALEYIKNKFSKPISRRAYYNYKNQMYKDHHQNSPFSGLYRFHESRQRTKDIISFSLISHRERIIRNGLIKGNITSRNEFSRLDDPELSLKKMREKEVFLIKESEKVLVKINSKIQIANKNSKSIPKNATIRKEYIKCGKDMCLRCKHGPYYYAYWKDESGKLKKKYVGRDNPRERTGIAIQDNSNNLENILRNNHNDLEAVFNNRESTASP
jgi:cytochrome b involved in lipid metabolism